MVDYYKDNIMALQIPVFQTLSADFTQVVTLENTDVTIRLTFNTRTESWMMNLSAGNYSLNGIKLVKNFPLLMRHKALFPVLDGDLIVLKISDDVNINDLDYESLGLYFTIFYVTSEEIELWRDVNGL